MINSKFLHETQTSEISAGMNNNNSAKENSTINPRWDKLPAVVMHEVFSYLNLQDRIQSSEVCWDWREAFFDPGLWTNIIFRLEDTSKKSQTSSLADHWAHSVKNATVQYHIPLDIHKLECLLRQFRENANLKQLFIEPTVTTGEAARSIDAKDLEELKKSIICSILEAITSARKLEALSIGCIEPLLRPLDAIVNQLAKHHGKSLIHLSLTSAPNDDPLNYQPAMQSSLSFKSFERITTLTLNYEYVNDALLHSLDSGTLERLIVHVHKWSDDHPGTTDAAWQALKSKNQRCELRLNFLHAYTAIKVAHEKILRPAMPLTHFKALFCKEYCTCLLHTVTTWYRESVKSIISIDFVLRYNFQVPTAIHHNARFGDDCIVACPNLTEFMLLGHYSEMQCRREIEGETHPGLYIKAKFTNEDGNGFISTYMLYEDPDNLDDECDFDDLERNIQEMIEETKGSPIDIKMYPAFKTAFDGDTKGFINLLLLKDTNQKSDSDVLLVVT